MSALDVFRYGEHEVRTVLIEGEPWFVLNDLCAVLDLGSSHKVAARLDEDDRTQIPVIDSMGRGQQTVAVNESGMYDVVLRSDKPEARQVRWWITHEVLPAIRKTGAYSTVPALSEDEIVHQALTILVAKTERLEAKIAKDAPKVHFAEAVAASPTTILVGDLAKILRGNGVLLGARRLFERLRAEGYLIRRAGSDWNMPTQKSMELGLFEIKESTRQSPDGVVHVTKTPKVTGKGQQYFIERYTSQDGVLDVEAVAS